ncbi:TonB-dependent receptor [Gilvimarinus sp. SDUM040013]|uniref:TonB-dependent receptor n=1 Tax=Gilvimarinus gilvus TaxID=3058038 RepID=A0ABU4S1Q3_9GAMM|nr:TonB-dependent receptor [Gilvimarinus sp. SDUM040013]MDO3386247.1 TonB-dependent receptor [Gilvimarinus sp. SDUM040013]MDX6849758.1 TonB-dependent receptor [Gilvimarinus sp. SDUM040013]
MITRTNHKGATIATSCSALALALSLSAPGYAQEGAEDMGLLEEVVVTGFRQSLSQALDVKREAVGTVDAILAEDIADFPDQNLAESLQRIPGVTITRDSGEGRAISVRGLSGEFTRIRINGMEAIATTGGEGGPNRGRGFDFNVFASELFNSIVVRKTASANVDEGSLGAVVDLNTGRPFNYKEGVTFAANVEGQYNDLTEDTGPRVSGLFAYNDPEGVWGASVSAAYSDTTTEELGQNTVRWAQAGFATVKGVDCAANPGDSGCAEVSNAFHPRIPRYGQIEVKRERLGLTAGLQFRPSDATTVSIDALYSELDASRGEKWGEVLLRGNESGMDVLDYTYDPATNNLTMMEMDNAWVRNENFEKAWTTEFSQIGLDIEHEFSDNFSGHLLVGQSESTLNFSHEITFMYDDRDYEGYLYDYSDDETPILAFNGPDVTDPTNFQMSEFRDRPTNTVHGFDNLAVDFTWQMSDAFSVDFGASYKKFTFETEGFRRDSTVCGNENIDFNCDPNGDGTNELYGIWGTPELSEVYNFGDSVAAGSTSSWVIPSLDGWINEIDLFNQPLREDQGNIREVEEEDTALFVQLNGDLDFGGMDFRFDVGVRYAETNQTSSGYNSGTYVTVDRDAYDDILPSFNTALWLTEDLVWRVAGSQVMTRPGLGNLSPGGSVDPFNYRVSYKNPYLDPTRADSLDTSIEWYFADEAALSFAVFYKDIESRPIGTESEGTYASTGLPLSLLNPTSPAGQNPEGQPWTISSLGDGPGGAVEGFELAYQSPLSVFGGKDSILDNFGVIANYTYVDSEVDYTFGDEIITERLFGLSNYSYNATLYYEDDKFNARISAAYRDDYLTGTSGNNNRFEGYGGTMNVDVSAGYALTENLDLKFEAINLTDDYQDRFTDLENKRRYEWDHTGRVFTVGVKYTM